MVDMKHMPKRVLSFFKALRVNPATQHIPVVLLTASPTDRDGLDKLQVIRKPFDPMRLPAQIASALGWAA